MVVLQCYLIGHCCFTMTLFTYSKSFFLLSIFSCLTINFFLLPLINRGMKRKRFPAGHHRNEWVFIHSLGHACIISSLAVRPWPRCCQWSPCQHLGQWRASSVGEPFSRCSWTQHALNSWGTATQHSRCAFLFFSNPASIWAPGCTSLMARGRWTTSCATNTKRGGAPSHVFPSRPTGASTSRCWRGWRRRRSLRRPTHRW